MRVPIAIVLALALLAGLTFAYLDSWRAWVLWQEENQLWLATGFRRESWMPREGYPSLLTCRAAARHLTSTKHDNTTVITYRGACFPETIDPRPRR